MLQKIQIKHGVICKKFEELPDGEYLVTLINLKAEVPELRRLYFALLDAAVYHTGETKQDLHDQNKARNKITTTTHMDKSEWMIFIDEFKWYLSEQYEIYL